MCILETNRSLNVLFVYQDESLPSSRVRVQNLIPELEALSINATQLSYPKTTLARIKLYLKIRHFDVVFIQKKLLNFPDSVVMNLFARHLVYDFDDAVYFRDDSATSADSHTRRRRFNRMMRISDLVIAGNRVLASEAEKMARRVEILPSAVPSKDVIVKENYEHGGPVIIGWLGGGGNLHHLSSIGPILQALAKTHAFYLHVVSNVDFKLEGVQVVNIPWQLEDQEYQISRFDIGLMPLPDNWWTRGKCGYKALQYMASGVATVCSAVGANADMIEHGVDGFAVSDDAGFSEAIQTLIDDSLLRRELGQKARVKIERGYSIQVVARRLAGILSQRVEH